MEGKDKISVTLIRHCHSKFNLAEATHGFESIQYNPELIDPELTDLGIQQAKEVSEKLKNKQYDFVFVSPLTRALQTAALLFGNHPTKPKFVVMPSLSEMFLCSSDFGSDYYHIKRTFHEVDFSHVEKLKKPEYWYLECLQSEEWVSSILEEADKEGITELSQAALFILEKIKGTTYFPESPENFVKRVEMAKACIKDFIAKEGTDKSYAVITHYWVLMELTKSEEAPAGKIFKNCQFADHILD